jgi:hypothetical protein
MNMVLLYFHVSHYVLHKHLTLICARMFIRLVVSGRCQLDESKQGKYDLV